MLHPSLLYNTGQPQVFRPPQAVPAERVRRGRAVHRRGPFRPVQTDPVDALKAQLAEKESRIEVLERLLAEKDSRLAERDEQVAALRLAAGAG